MSKKLIALTPLLCGIYFFTPVQEAKAGNVTVIQQSTTVVQPSRRIVRQIPDLLFKEEFHQSKMFGTNIDALVGLGTDQKLYFSINMSSVGGSKRLFTVKLIDAAGNTFGYLNPELKKFGLAGSLIERYAIKLHPEIAERLATVEIMFEKTKKVSEEELTTILREDIRSKYADGSAKRFGQFSYVLSPLIDASEGSVAATSDEW